MENTRTSKKLCSGGSHSSDNYINSQHVKPKIIQSKQALIQREETVTGKEKQWDGLSDRSDTCRSLGSFRMRILGRKMTEVSETKPRPCSGMAGPSLQDRREEH